MSPPGSRAREARAREARDAEYADYRLREPLASFAKPRSPPSLLERLAYASATRREIEAIDRDIVAAFNRHHWHRDSCPDATALARYVRFALIRRGLKVGGKKRAARLARLIRERALARVRPEDDEDDPYWWR